MADVKVIDNFFTNPDKLRELALKFDYPKPKEDVYYPGCNSAQKMIIPGLTEKICSIVGEPLIPVPKTAHEKCRLALKGDKGEGSVHIDQAHWTGVYCLFKPEDCQGGTDFFHHLPSKTDHAPLGPDELVKFGVSTYNELWVNVLNPQSNDPTKWKHLKHYPMAFNRLILFRPWFWHDAGPGFGDSVENGRLIFTLFYQEAPS